MTTKTQDTTRSAAPRYRVALAIDWYDVADRQPDDDAEILLIPATEEHDESGWHSVQPGEMVSATVDGGIAYYHAEAPMSHPLQAGDLWAADPSEAMMPPEKETGR